jgi:hypothetical protein
VYYFMEKKLYLKKIGNLIGVISFCISCIVFLLLLNWLFKITPYKRLQGMPLLIAPIASSIGFILGLISQKRSPNNYARLGLFSNAILFLFPLLYWTIGVLVFGP